LERRRIKKMNKAYPKRINHKYYKDKINVDWLLEPGHINFEAGIGCRLKCGGCMMRFHMSPKAEKYESQAWDCRYNISFDSYKVVFDVFTNFQFIGNLSDPIYHPDFIKTLKYMKGKEIGAKFHTNGSGKTKKWWTEVYKLSQGENWKWIFGLDGLPKDSHIYRINQNGEQVWEMMKLGRSMGVTIDWQWIVFKYNQYDIDEGKLMAARYDINFLEMRIIDYGCQNKIKFILGSKTGYKFKKMLLKRIKPEFIHDLEKDGAFIEGFVQSRSNKDGLF